MQSSPASGHFLTDYLAIYWNITIISDNKREISIYSISLFLISGKSFFTVRNHSILNRWLLKRLAVL